MKKMKKFILCHECGEYINNFLFIGAILQTNNTICDQVMHVMGINVNMFGFGVIQWIIYKMNSTLIVTYQLSEFILNYSNLNKDMPNPYCFFSYFLRCPIFFFTWREIIFFNFLLDQEIGLEPRLNMYPIV
jgi:hypothetical protein